MRHGAHATRSRPGAPALTSFLAPCLLQYSVPQSPMHLGGGTHDSASYDSDTSCMSNVSVVISPHASGSPGTGFAADTPRAGVSYCNPNPFYWQRVVSPETMESLPFYAASGHPAMGSPMPMGSPHYPCAPRHPYRLLHIAAPRATVSNPVISCDVLSFDKPDPSCARFLSFGETAPPPLLPSCAKCGWFWRWCRFGASRIPAGLSAGP